MQETNALLFELIRYELLSSPISEETKEKLKDEECFKTLIKLAVSHDMLHLAADALITSGIMTEDNKYYDKVSKSLMVAVYRYQQIEYTSRLIYSAFEENGIDFIPLKGSVTRGFYPKPWMRTSCDADILVKKEQVDKAISILTDKLGGVAEWSSPHDVPVKFKNSVNVELHFTLREKWFKSSVILEKVWDYAVLNDEKKHSYRLTDEMFYFYHIAHMAKHFKIGGCGIKPFVDTFLINRALENTEERKALISKGGLTKFEEYAIRLSNAWMTGEEDAELNDMEEYVLSGGVYGHENEVNGKTSAEEVFRIDRVFIPLTELKYKYKALEKHTWLYPFFALVRVFRLAFVTLPSVVVNKIKSSKNKETDKVSSLFKKIDL